MLWSFCVRHGPGHAISTNHRHEKEEQEVRGWALVGLLMVLLSLMLVGGLCPVLLRVLW